MELDRLLMVDSIKGYKSKSTIFEINSNNKSNASEVMRAKRSRDDRLVDKFSKARAERIVESTALTIIRTEPQNNEDEQEDDELQTVFSEVVGGKRKNHDNETDRPKSKKNRKSGKDEEFYIPYRPKDFNSERGLSLGSDGGAFEQQASSAVLDLMGDESNTLNQHKSLMKWDRKRKRFVRDSGKEDKNKKIKTESGQVVSGNKKKKSFYEDWKKKYKIDDRASDSDGETGGARRFGGRRGRGQGGAQSRPGQQQSDSRVRSELKNRDQILKQRKRKAKQQFLQSGGMKKLRSKGRQRLQQVMRSGFGRGSFKKGKMRKKL
ncbi:ATP-dependent RNA helicase DDX54 [Labeo rohita]|uniref:ATP-dependent RNA helicase DDX54 n=2 Tax=Labeo rohita TaxID=84645 RepID=A0A498LRP4_LABRO|nr:ATP-dependent RNA helicase DDX54 [Labeo rohita]